MFDSYEVWMTQGQGEVKCREFNTLKEAIDYCRPRNGVDGSYAIKKQPENHYVEWQGT